MSPAPLLPDGGRFARLPESYRGEGLRVRFSRIPGETPKGVLTTALYLPVVIGESFSVSEEAAFTDYETVGDGEFSQPRGGSSTARNLRTLDDVETLTLDWARYARWMTNPDVTETQLRRTLYGILRSRRPFEILATLQLGAGAEELRMKATLRSVARTLKRGETDTRYYVLGIKEWREDSVERKGQKAAKGGDLPAKKKLTASTTCYSAAREFYDLHEVSLAGAARAIRQANGLGSWGLNTPIAQAKKFKVGDSIKIPDTALEGEVGDTKYGADLLAAVGG
jgi:hypothetical protein